MESKKKMLFIFNPFSGKAQIKSKLFEIIDVFVKGGYEVIVHPTQAVGDGFEKTKELAPQVDLVVCSGGDGTLDEVVSGLMEVDQRVPIGYIPAGSTNDFANSLSISKDMVQAAKDIIEETCIPVMWERSTTTALSTSLHSAFSRMFPMRQTST